MRVILTRLSLVVLFVGFAGLLILFVMSVFASGIRNGLRDIEASTVRQLAEAVIMHAEEHNSILPETLEELEDGDFIFDQGKASRERFIYVAPRNATLKDLFPDTPIVLFPWHDGMHIGYAGGNVSFVPGGNPKIIPPKFMDEKLNWIRIILLSVMVNILLIGMLVYRGRKRI